MSKHTPEPWVLENGTVMRDGGKIGILTDADAVPIAFVEGVYRRDASWCAGIEAYRLQPEETMANARLLVNAPKLLAALRAMLAAYGPANEKDDDTDALIQARAVIADVEGE